MEDPFGWVGSTIDEKYRIDVVVGEGGFGVVYRAHHLGFGETVALKCLKLPGVLRGEDRKRFHETFVSEGRLLHKLSRSHAAIVQALDVGAAISPNGVWTPYLVLEWLDGRSLEFDLSRRAGQGRRIADAIAVLEPAVRGLQVAHAQNIAHRDIKPANIFLVESGGRSTTKILDFGIAKVLRETTNLTSALASTGGSIRAFTPQYGAPEQFDPRFGATGPWTDVFALALVLVELVSGRIALGGSDTTQLFILSTDRARRPTLRAHGIHVADVVEGVLAKALAVEPRERFLSAGSFWDALTAAVSQAESSRAEQSIGTPISSLTKSSSNWIASIAPTEAANTGTETEISSLVPPIETIETTRFTSSEPNRAVNWPPAPPPPRSPHRERSKLILITGTVGLVALGALIAVALSQRQEAATPGKIPETQGPSQPAPTAQLSDESTTSPNQTTHQLRSPVDYRQPCAATSTVQWKRVQVEGVGSTPDVRMWTAGKYVNAVEAVAWSPDGTLIASGGVDDDIHVIDTVCGLQRSVITVPRDPYSSEVNNLHFSPFDNLLVSAGPHGEGKSAVTLWPLGSGHNRPLRGPMNAFEVARFFPSGTRLIAGGWGTRQTDPKLPDGTVFIWRTDQAEPLHELKGHVGTVESVVVRSDERVVITGGSDGWIIFWDVESGKELRRIELVPEQPDWEPHTQVTSLAFVANESVLVAGVLSPPDKSQILSIDPATGKYTTLRTAQGDYRSLVEPLGNTLLAHAIGREIQIVERASGQMRWSFQGDGARINALTIAPDGKRLAIGTGDGKIGGQPGPHNAVLVFDIAQLILPPP